MRSLNVLTANSSDGQSHRVKRLLCSLPILLTLSFSGMGRANEEDQLTGNLPSAEQIPRKSEDPRHQQVERFVRTYFRTWSNRDTEGYDACFLPKASIQFIDSEGQLSTYTRAQFVASQRKYHRTARHRMTEVAESIDIRFESKLARAVVHWKLTAGPTTDFGYDHFTLIKHEGEWRIINLVFYSQKRN